MEHLIDLYCGSAAIADGKALLAADRQRRYESRQDAAGRTVLSAKYSDHFNFVDLARVVISANGKVIDSASCGCRSFTEEKGLCCHCAALLLQHEKSQPQKLMRAAAELAPEPARKKDIIQELLKVDLVTPREPKPAPEKDQADAGFAALIDALTDVAMENLEKAFAEEPAAEPEATPAADGEGAPTDDGVSPSPALAADGARTDGGNVRGIRDFSFRFGNTEEDLYPGDPHPALSRESFELIFGKTRKAEKLYSIFKNWNGTCYGIAAASGMFVDPEDPAVTDFRADAERPFDLRLSDRSDTLGLTLHRFIEAMFVSQMSDYIGAFRLAQWLLPLDEALPELVESVVDFEKSGVDPVVLELAPNAESNCGHTVFPYRYERSDETKSRLHIYDSNYPDEVRYLDLFQDEEGKYIGWRFQMQKDTDYSSKTGGILDFVPHTVYQIPWDVRNAHKDAKPKALFSTPCADLTVQDEEGSDVLKIAAGRITPLRDDVIPVRVNGAEAAADRYDCWIDQGAYRVINDDPERELAFDLTGDELGLEVKTEAKTVDALIDEETQALRVKLVDDEKKKWYVRLLDHAKDIVISASKSYLVKKLINVGIPVLLSIAGKLFLNNIAPEEISEFTVDGEPANVREHVTFENEQRAAVENEQPAVVENTVEADVYEETVDEEALYIANKKLDPEP